MGVGTNTGRGAKKRPSTASAPSVGKTARPQAADAPQGREAAKGGAATPEQVLTLSRSPALAFEAGGRLIVQALDRMQDATAAWRKREITKEERDKRWQAEWHEVMLNLNEHADAMITFLTTFCNAPCFRHLGKAERERERAERKAATMARLNTDGKPAESDGEGGAS